MYRRDPSHSKALLLARICLQGLGPEARDYQHLNQPENVLALGSVSLIRAVATRTELESVARLVLHLQI